MTTTTTSSRRVLWIAAPVGIVVVLFLVLLATSDKGGRGFIIGDIDGQLAPAIVRSTLDGDTFDLDSYRGSFVVVNFFQTSCIPCRVEHPELVAFQEAYAPSGVASVVSISFDDTEANIREFFGEFGGDWPIVVEDPLPIAVDYGVAAVPESAVVAPDGKVITKLIGGVRKVDLEAVMASWLQEQEDQRSGGTSDQEQTS
jgi:cytochrome c biogenesis protein CcmG, thiol:disulfide interchange protein DsbE